MEWAAFLHLIFLGAWLGCYAVEAMLELAALKNADLRRSVAQFHYDIDRFVEIPIFLGVLVTGALQVDTSRMHGWHLVKILTGILPVVINAACVFPVVWRKKAADAGSDEEVVRYSRQIYWYFAGVVPAFIPLAIGTYLRVG